MIDKTKIQGRIADLKNQGMSYQGIADRLRAEGLGDFSPSTIRRYLREIQGEQSSSTSPSTNVQKAPIGTPESIGPANAETSESNNNKTPSRLEEMIEADQKALRRLEIILFIAKIFFVSMVVFGIIITILKLA
ncbi:MAG: helix-turn-helix domain-containing protein [Candidatus Micrarchaeaceae archaeon]